MIVEVMPKEEIKKGDIIIATSMSDLRTSTKENQADLAIVLAKGPGYIDDEGEDVEIDIPIGSVVMVSRIGLRLYSQFPGLMDYTSETVALTRDTEVHCSWPSIEAYLAYREKLNA